MRIRIQGLETEIQKFYMWKQILFIWSKIATCIYLYLGLHEGRSSFIQEKPKKCLTFFDFCGSWSSRPKSIRIQSDPDPQHWSLDFALCGLSFWFFVCCRWPCISWPGCWQRLSHRYTSFSIDSRWIPGKNLSYIHLGSSVCRPVCHPVCRPFVVAERWVILYVLAIKLTKETRRRVCRGRD